MAFAFAEGEGDGGVVIVIISIVVSVVVIILIGIPVFCILCQVVVGQLLPCRPKGGYLSAVFYFTTALAVCRVVTVSFIINLLEAEVVGFYSCLQPLVAVVIGHSLVVVAVPREARLTQRDERDHSRFLLCLCNGVSEEDGKVFLAKALEQ